MDDTRGWIQCAHFKVLLKGSWCVIINLLRILGLHIFPTLSFSWRLNSCKLSINLSICACCEKLFFLSFAKNSRLVVDIPSPPSPPVPTPTLPLTLIGSIQRHVVHKKLTNHKYRCSSCCKENLKPIWFIHNHQTFVHNLLQYNKVAWFVSKWDFKIYMCKKFQVSQQNVQVYKYL